MSRRALFVGRFQPFHLGHLNCVKKILSENREIVIVVGSAQENFTRENPFTVGERMEMVAAALKAEKLDCKAAIVPVPDTNESAIWAKRVLSYCPKIDGPAYSNNSWTTMLLRREGLQVKALADYRGIAATEVRRRIREKQEWKTLVPKAVAEFVTKNGLDARVRELEAQRL
ncbi:MAG: nicotinamide-nucleotide adenylyltransferase [Candidatus Micrarchaeia archaeon]|jgi:nicotinamide-nucleotide adenylyltransferase